MPWWKQGSGYSERGRKDRRLSMSERPLAWPIQLGSAASVLLGSPPSCVKPFLPPGSWLRCALVTSVMTRLHGFKAACCAAAVLPGSWKWPIVRYMPAPRRTVYMHDDWVWHRSSDRFVRNMLTIGSSGINQALSKELTFVTLDAVSDRHPNWEHLVGAADLAGLQILFAELQVFVVLINALFAGYQDFSGVIHPGLTPVSTPAPIVTPNEAVARPKP